MARKRPSIEQSPEIDVHDFDAVWSAIQGTAVDPEIVQHLRSQIDPEKDPFLSSFELKSFERRRLYQVLGLHVMRHSSVVRIEEYTPRGVGFIYKHARRQSPSDAESSLKNALQKLYGIEDAIDV